MGHVPRHAACPRARVRVCRRTRVKSSGGKRGGCIGEREGRREGEHVRHGVRNFFSSESCAHGEGVYMCIAQFWS